MPKLPRTNANEIDSIRAKYCAKFHQLERCRPVFGQEYAAASRLFS